MAVNSEDEDEVPLVMYMKRNSAEFWYMNLIAWWDFSNEHTILAVTKIKPKLHVPCYHN